MVKKYRSLKSNSFHCLHNAGHNYGTSPEICDNFYDA